MESAKRNKNRNKQTAEKMVSFTWNRELIDKARSEHYYIKVTSEKSKQLLITGAIVRWKKDKNSNDVYSPDFRLVGDEKSIKEILIQNSYPEKDVVALLKNCYSRDNVNSVSKDRFEKEIKDCREFKKNNKKISGASTLTLNKLSEVVSNLPTNASNIPAKKKLAIQRDTAIKEKYDNLYEGQLMDVSSLKSDGSGIKNRSATQAPKNKFGDIESIPIISSDIKNYEIVLRALTDYIENSMIDTLVERFKEQEKNSVSKKQLINVEKVPNNRNKKLPAVKEKPEQLKKTPLAKPKREAVKTKIQRNKINVSKETPKAKSVTTSSEPEKKSEPVVVEVPTSLTVIDTVSDFVPMQQAQQNKAVVSEKLRKAITNRGKVSRKSPTKV